MAKPKTYPLRALYEAVGTNQPTIQGVLKRAGIKPQQEIKIGKMTYRSFGQDAMDAALAWRAEKDNPAPLLAELVADPDPVAKQSVPSLAPDVGVVLNELIRRVDVLATQHRTDRSEIDTGMRCLNNKLDRLTVMVRALSTEWGINAATLNGAAHGPADDAQAEVTR